MQTPSLPGIGLGVGTGHKAILGFFRFLGKSKSVLLETVMIYLLGPPERGTQRQ